MKSLVTGGGGFLGRYIVEKLLARGDDVVSLSRNNYPELQRAGVDVIRADITDEDKVISACKGVDAVFHTAARVGIWGPWSEFYETNVTGTRNLLKGCIKHGVTKFVYTSSPSVIFDGKDHEGIDETYPYPKSYTAHYPKTKAMAEQEVLAANGSSGLLMTCSLRPHLVWGPRDTNLIPRLVDRAESGKLRIVGDGMNMVDTVYVENAADAHILAADRLAPGSVVCGSAYFITQGEPVNCWEWVNEILTRLGKPKVTKKISFKTAYVAGAVLELAYSLLRKNSEPAMTRFLAMQLALCHYFNIDKAKRELGYAPAVDTEEGLRRLVEHMR